MRAKPGMPRAMRPSRVLEKLRAGGVVSCYKSNLDSARSIEIAALAGFDCVWVDTEHVALDWSLIERQIWAAKAHDCDAVVRVARGSYSDLIRPLEMDAAGIMVPHVMSVADAKSIVRQTRCHPIGLRPLDGGNADGLYTALDLGPYIEQANSQRFVIVQIEDPEPLAELDEIAALEGIDMLFFGPGDFSQAIGAPGQWDHPEIGAARRAVAEASARHGKFAGTVGNPTTLPELVAMGYNFVSVGADVVSLTSYCAGLLQAFEPLESAEATREPDSERAGRSAYA